MDKEFAGPIGRDEADDDRFTASDRSGVPGQNQNYSTITANFTGGQGKTLTGMLVRQALADAGVAVKLVSIDTQAGSGERSKLGLMHPETQDLAISPDMGVLTETHGEMLLDHWDGFASVLRGRNFVADMGANVIGTMLEWARVASPVRIMGGRPVNFLVVTTKEEQSVNDALRVIDAIERTRDAMAIGRIGVVMNESRGAFSEGAGHVARLREVVTRNNYPVITLPFCNSFSQADSFSIARLRAMTYAEYQKARGIAEELTAMRQLDRIHSWIDGAVSAICDAGFAPAKIA